MKKLKSVENDIQHLIKIRHPNLLSLLAVKLTARFADEAPRLVILSEQQPTITLHDILEDCEALREQRALVCLKRVRLFAVSDHIPQDYATQLLSALNVVHTNGLVHKGTDARVSITSE
jgi:translation initiation factor 2-alpha kinase 4